MKKKIESVNKRITFTAFKIFLIFSILFLSIEILILNSLFKKEIVSRTRDHAEFISKITRDYIINYNLFEIGKIVNYEIEQKKVLFIAIFDKDKNLIRSNLFYIENRDRLSETENFSVKSLVINSRDFSFFGSGKKNYIDGFGPVIGNNGKVIGFFHIGMVFPSYVKLYRTILFFSIILVLFFFISIFLIFRKSTKFVENAIAEIIFKIKKFSEGNFSEVIDYKTKTTLDILKERINILFRKYSEEHKDKENLIKNFEKEMSTKNLSLKRLKNFYENIFDKVGEYVFVVDFSGFVKLANKNFLKKVKDEKSFKKLPLLKFLGDRVKNPRKLFRYFLKAYRGKDIKITEYIRDMKDNFVLFDIFLTPIEGLRGERNVLVIGKESLREVIREESILDRESIITLGKMLYLEMLLNLRSESKFNPSMDIKRKKSREIFDIIEFLREKSEKFGRNTFFEIENLNKKLFVSSDLKTINSIFDEITNFYEREKGKKRIRKVEISLNENDNIKFNGDNNFVKMSVKFFGVKFDSLITSPWEIFSTEKNFGDSDVRFFFDISPYLLKFYENGGYFSLNKNYTFISFELFLPTVEKRRVKRESILLIDDEESIVEVVKEFLSEFGYKVLTANRGEDGIEIFKEKRDEIFAVILDVLMPGIGGEKTYQELRKIDRDVFILLASGYTGRDFESTIFLKDDRSSFLHKPFDFEELIEKLKSIR